MGKNQLITIVIPVFNGENTLSYSLNSLLNQTYKNFEAIIVDDGSIDNTSDIAKKYSFDDRRFKYHYQENAGVSMARNKGIELSSGDFICFLDSDDYFDNTYLEKMYEKITKTNNHVCYCGYNIVSPNSKSMKKTMFKNGDILREIILGKINVHTTGWMIKRDFLLSNDIKFLKGVSWGEDIEFFCEVLAKTNRVCYVDEYLTNYKVEFEENKLSSFSMDKIDKDFESIMRMVKNKEINKNKKINNSLLDYRLQALIVYRLVGAYNMKVDDAVLLDYYNKYKRNILKPTFNNGLRSIKLNLYKVKLLHIVNKLR